MIRKTILQYLFLVALTRIGGIAIISATYVTFLTSKGLNLFEVNLVNFVFFCTLFLCEIPTGAYADVFGRKASYLISCLLISLGMFVYGASTSFWGFALAEAISAVGMTFASGAFQAWLVDTLKHHGYEGRMERIFVYEQIVIQISGAGAAILGAYLADVNEVLPWHVGGVGMLVTAVYVMLRMKEEYFIPQKFSFRRGVEALQETIAVSVRYGVNSKPIRFILLIASLQFFAIQAPNMQWQPFFMQFLTQKVSLGFIFAGITAALVVGSVFVARATKVEAHARGLLVGSQVVAGIGITATVWMSSLPMALTVFLLHEVARGFYRPVKDAYLHSLIPSKERATIVSFESIAHHAGGAVGLLLSGAIAHWLGITAAWTVSGLVLIAGTLFIAKSGNTKTAL